MLLVELFVIVVAVLLAEQFQVLVTDDNDTRTPLQQAGDVLLLIECAGILQGLVVVAETGQAHPAQSLDILEFHVEIAHQIVGEVEACHLEQQLVLVDGVGLVGNDKQEVGIALRLEHTGSNGIAVAEHIAAALPHIAHVELTATKLTALLDAVDNHAGHGTHRTRGVFLHHGLHVVETSLAVAHVEFAKTSNEDELIAVGAQLETFL